MGCCHSCYSKGATAIIEQGNNHARGDARPADYADDSDEDSGVPELIPTTAPKRR